MLVSLCLEEQKHGQERINFDPAKFIRSRLHNSLFHLHNFFIFKFQKLVSFLRPILKTKNQSPYL